RGPRCVLSCATHPLSIRSFPTRRSSDLSTHDRRGETFATNLEGTENVLTAARKVGVERVVLASSCNIYGRATCTDIDETTSPDPDRKSTRLNSSHVSTPYADFGLQKNNK